MNIFSPQKKSKERFAHGCKCAMFAAVMALVMAAAACGRFGQAVDTPPSPRPAPAALSASPVAAPPLGGARSLQPAIPAVSPTLVPRPGQNGTQPAGSSPLISKITVTFYGDAATAKGFTWYTSGESTSSDVQVVEQRPGRAPNFRRAATYTGTVSKSRNSPNELVHKAAATGLTANTAYAYRVGDAKLNIWSEAAVFTTAPERGPFTFINLSDTQFSNQAGAKVTADVIAAAFSQTKHAGFIVHNGDVVDNQSEKLWDMLLQTSKTSLMNTTIMPASGNHDVGSYTFIDHFHLDTPASATKTGAYYSVDYSNAHFVVLNTNESSGDYKNFTDAQVAWMTHDITSAKNAGAQWIIVVIHMGPYTIGAHSLYANVKDTREKIAPLFNELGVDLVLQGHDHVYERSKPIVNGAAAEKTTAAEPLNGHTTEYIIDPKGPVYLTPGTAGTKHYHQNPQLSKDYLSLFDVADGPYQGDPDMKNQETFMSITIDGPTLTATAYQMSKSKNGGAPYIIDQFGIKKTA